MIVSVPEVIINTIPITDKMSNFSLKKKLPYIVAHIIWQKKKGLITLLCLPTRWKANVIKKIDKNINIPPPQTNSHSVKVKKIGSIKKNRALMKVNGKIK